MTGRQLALLAVAGSTLLLSGAFVFQLAGYPPCKMCLWQRWPHGAAIVIGLAFLVFGNRVLLWLAALAALTTSSIGFYHAGVEQAWWQGPSTCTSGSIQDLSVDELLAKIIAAPVVRCDEIAWQLAGISMAGWNAILSLTLVLIWVTVACRHDHL